MNYAELVRVIEETVKRRKMAQEAYDELLKQSHELKEKVPAIEEELNQIWRRSQALDGLTIPAEVAHKL